MCILVKFGCIKEAVGKSTHTALKFLQLQKFYFYVDLFGTDKTYLTDMYKTISQNGFIFCKLYNFVGFYITISYIYRANLVFAWSRITL